ncbi:MAG: Rne/Rng family ribonuclease [Rickettsiales bacterium]|jgi:ribonuclease E|nr:Rne/Rng family ribonuclease [Rickettsiales bacterium]
MSKKLYIDAAFADETRVVLLDEKGAIESIDRETPSIKQLRGNIYLAKIIRLEPSLQSAFINYGGDRHGFLPFSDIHPHYYNIPESKKHDLSAVKFFNEMFAEKTDLKSMDDGDEITEADSEDFEEENFLMLDENNQPILLEEDAEDAPAELVDKATREREDADEEEQFRYEGYYHDEYKKYKIENVLKEDQTLLVQVIKEERGNKGVALTTYISIAGKYSVLMPNVEGKGGISKKITNIWDRKVLKNILNVINPDDRKSIIIRTAGIGKKPGDILRDYVYLSRLWKTIRQETLRQKAPTFIHSEDDILKRSVRDLIGDGVKEIVVSGKEAFKTIKNLANLMIPEQKVSIREYDEKIPLFYKTGIEDQVLQLYDNKIGLPSGGSIVIDQTEALVAIDVNSGKATKQDNVEEMAVVINLEAIKEIARQLRLRDIGGLIVIDFIDMVSFRNRRLIERSLRDAFADDKARVQIDKISMFGLLEMSRQRINASFSEKISEKCPYCDGKGSIRSKYIVGENILRNIKYCARDKNCKIFTVDTTKQMAEYLLNYKRNEIKKIEQDFGLTVLISINLDRVDNGYGIEKRENLTPLEKSDLFPTQNIGVVNELFEDSDFYKNYEKELNDIEFSDNCFYNRKDDGERSSSPTENFSSFRDRKQFRKRGAAPEESRRQNISRGRAAESKRPGVAVFEEKKKKTSLVAKLLGVFR